MTRLPRIKFDRSSIADFSILIILLLSACGRTHSPSGFTNSPITAVNTAQNICIQTFNAYGPAYSTDITGRTKVLGEELNLDPCQIIQMQEVWTESHYELATAATRQSLPFLSATRFDDFEKPYLGKSGLAIFTSDFLSHQSFEKFSVNQDGLLDRVRGIFSVIKGLGSSDITLRKDRDKTLHMINLHTHPSSQSVRIAQVAQFLARFESMLPLTAPVVVTGDFNFKPDSIEYELMRDVALLTDSYKSANGQYNGQECTYCADNPHHWGGGSRVVDYIWLRSTATQQVKPQNAVINLRGLGDIIPSDHFGLRSDIQLSEAPEPSVSKNEFTERKSAAVRALDLALSSLEADNATELEYQETATRLQAYRRRITTGNPSDPLLAQMLIP